ncbi:hypothetical protein JD844_034300 [Phrynosoma platyrhinos]|uniref:Uncharacterized protein n=1 Tax=Phrynosoma platyrhinos TaxID=52577 RepID=A0ABQ7T9N1_PHRPL|nr:hypothetical protein JD844_034300 [Phrynosoma platyrhinos]
MDMRIHEKARKEAPTRSEGKRACRLLISFFSFFPFQQPGFLPSEMGISSPSTLSPTGVKGGSQYYPYGNNPRRRGAESNIDGQPKKVRKVPPGLPSSVYPPNSGDDYNRETTSYAPSKPPSTVYPGAFYMPGTMGQSNYGVILGASSSPLPQSGNFSGLHQHERMGETWVKLMERSSQEEDICPFSQCCPPNTLFISLILHPSFPELPDAFRRGQWRTPIGFRLFFRFHSVRSVQPHASHWWDRSRDG